MATLKSKDYRIMTESIAQFEQRKQDHIEHALNPSNQAIGLTGLDAIQLQHEAFPELNFDEVEISQSFLGQWRLATPFLVSSMTAGHHQAININETLALACQERGWLMGVGSQRRELNDPNAHQEWQRIRSHAPKVKLLGNIGLAQLITHSIQDIQKLCDSINAVGLFVHCNPLQECLQPEGTPQFRGGYQALEQLCKQLDLPVIVKETGCGFSEKTLARLKSTGVTAIDVSGLGGTHWGRIEGCRAQALSVQQQTSESFKSWGIATVDALFNAKRIDPNYQVWASGGVRSGLDAAKLLALGAQIIGIAKPMLEAALQGVEAVTHLMNCIEYELKTALFCTGSANILALQETAPWKKLS